jgi:aspartate/methionine/tyrosine aminotransferase
LITSSVESARLRRTHLPERAPLIGMSVREADLSLRLDGAGHGLLDTTHFDTVRFPPPAWALPTFAAAASDGAQAYSAYRGHDEVRRTCAESISGLLGIDVDPTRNLAMSTGTQGGLFAVLSALVDEGDVVVLADPEYLFVERMLRFLGAEVVRLPIIDTERGPELDLDLLETLSATGIRLLLTSNPNNPTGTVFNADMIARLGRIAVRDDFFVVIDELYCRLVFDGTVFTHLAAEPGMADRTVTMLGGSKTESLSGYRVGMVVAPAGVIDAVEQLLAMLCLRAPAYAQHVMTKWLREDHDFVAQRVLEIQALQHLTVEHLRAVPGLTVTPGAGTAYLWPDVSALGLTDVQVARVLQDEAKVVISPGYQFGPSGLGHFRICYAREETSWERALQAMTSALTTATNSR